MKKYVLFLVVIGIAQILVGCSTNSPVSNDEEKPSYEELEEQLEAITNERDSLKAELDALEEELESKQETATVQDGDVTVLVTDKSVTPKDSNNWIFSNYVNFVFSITNNTEKDIQGIQGELDIRDLFGAEIMTVGCDFTGETIAAGATITNDDLSFECNEFMNDHMKLFNEDYKDLQFIYHVKQIVFTDGTTKTATE